MKRPLGGRGGDPCILRSQLQHRNWPSDRRTALSTAAGSSGPQAAPESPWWALGWGRVQPRACGRVETHPRALGVSLVRSEVPGTLPLVSRVLQGPQAGRGSQGRGGDGARPGATSKGWGATREGPGACTGPRPAGHRGPGLAGELGAGQVGLGFRASWAQGSQDWLGTGVRAGWAQGVGQLGTGVRTGWA